MKHCTGKSTTSAKAKAHEGRNSQMGGGNTKEDKLNYFTLDTHKVREMEFIYKNSPRVNLFLVSGGAPKMVKMHEASTLDAKQMYRKYLMLDIVNKYPFTFLQALQEPLGHFASMGEREREKERKRQRESDR